MAGQACDCVRREGFDGILRELPPQPNARRLCTVSIGHLKVFSYVSGLNSGARLDIRQREQGARFGARPQPLTPV